jgi:leucyl aminopeptidase
MKAINLGVSVSTSISGRDSDGFLCVIGVDGKNHSKLESMTAKLPAWLKQEFIQLAKKRDFKPKAGGFLAFDSTEGVRKTLMLVDSKASKFELLSAARKVIEPAVFDAKVKNLTVDLSQVGALSDDLADAIISSAAAKLYKFPKYEGPQKDKKPKSKIEDDTLDICVVVTKVHTKSVQKIVERSITQTTAGTNLVRWLAKRAGNDLTCKNYVSYLRQLSRERRWMFKHHTHDWLEKMKAGAFLAVVKGSPHKDYGIVELTYTPKVKTTKHLALVGKGMVFDTGGHCLKPSAYMLGMHGDMAGSAVALAVLNVAALEKWPIKVTAYLAVADNMIGPQAYKPNDVITSMKGTTIEIIDTDAEGRMVLADTLFYAAKSKPALMMDFATLTGACIRAIGTTYSGVFTNRLDLHTDLIKAGANCGERVWPFPMDKDFAECLESTVADLKQCREKGGVDHIEAAQFLMHFAGDETPWVHVDLSAIEHSGGLAHVASDETGFGVRFATEFLRNYFKFR